MEEDVIETGLKALTEKKLKVLEDAIGTHDDIHKEVDSYMDIRRICEKENIDISGYNQKYHQLIDKYWKKKSEGENIK